ncbi:hypothetical protein [Burkholderia cepacia]|uniref:hypothetical protein n=1 Tax=Burkholderia cepacia TaxID=292 RepID=UPI0038B6B9AB
MTELTAPDSNDAAHEDGRKKCRRHRSAWQFFAVDRASEIVLRERDVERGRDFPAHRLAQLPALFLFGAVRSADADPPRDLGPRQAEIRAPRTRGRASVA